MSNEPSKASGNYNSVVGGASQTLGQAIGNDSLANSGAQQKQQGDAEYKAAQAQGYAEGTADRLTGAKDRVVGNLTGDDAQHASGQLQSANGKAQQKLNDPNPSVPNATTFDASNPSKANAQTNTLLGSVKETIGQTLGFNTMQAEGAQQRKAGDVEQTEAEAKGYVQGAIDQVSGYGKSVIGAITGDTAQQQQGNLQQSKGETQKEINK